MLDMHGVGNETISMLKLKPCLELHKRGGRGAKRRRLNVEEQRSEQMAQKKKRKGRCKIRGQMQEKGGGERRTDVCLIAS